MATLAWPCQSKTPATELQADHDGLDPAASLWVEWKVAALTTQALCRKQQRLEAQLVQDVGFPQATIRRPDSGEKLTLFSTDAIDDLCGSDPGMIDLRTEAEAELAAHQARWDAADEQIGYSIAKEAEEEAGNQERDLVDALTATPAISLAGIAGKLDMVLYEGVARENDIEFPWPCIRSALRDLVRIGQVMEPDVFMPGSDRETF